MFLASKENCNGCSACANACPRKCIDMVANDEGFLYPSINLSFCIQCGLCERICPVIKQETAKKSYDESWCVISKEKDILLNSSSGGAFSCFANAVIKRKGYVLGAAFVNDFSKVNHVVINDISKLSELRGAKYVQSEIGNAYEETKRLLETGRIVMFSGTPCQITGLLSYLGKNYENLYCIDVVCHGTPSVNLWRKYLNWIKGKDKGDVNSVSFRDKRNGWYNYGLKVSTAQAEYFCQNYVDPYMKIYLNNFCLRESCYNCYSKERGSGSDITIGDFWGIENLNLNLDYSLGASLVLIHTEKGKKFFEGILNQVIAVKTEYDKSLLENPCYNHSVTRPIERSGFYQELNDLSWNRLVRKYGREKERIFDRFTNYIHRVFRR